MNHPRHSSSPEDRAFLLAFETGAATPAQFNHEAHLRLAYVCLVDDGLAGAQARMRAALTAFLRAHALPPGKFHETLTRAWLLAVRHFMGKGPSASFAEFLSNSQPLLDSRAMLTHYSPDRLFSPQARAGFVEPDLQAIPG